jgi:hypothetical protein
MFENNSCVIFFAEIVSSSQLEYITELDPATKKDLYSALKSDQYNDCRH